MSSFFFHLLKKKLGGSIFLWVSEDRYRWRDPRPSTTPDLSSPLGSGTPVTSSPVGQEGEGLGVKWTLRVGQIGVVDVVGSSGPTDPDAETSSEARDDRKDPSVTLLCGHPGPNRVDTGEEGDGTVAPEPLIPEKIPFCPTPHKQGSMVLPNNLSHLRPPERDGPQEGPRDLVRKQGRTVRTIRTTPAGVGFGTAEGRVGVLRRQRPSETPRGPGCRPNRPSRGASGSGGPGRHLSTHGPHPSGRHRTPSTGSNSSPPVRGLWTCVWASGDRNRSTLGTVSGRVLHSVRP